MSLPNFKSIGIKLRRFLTLARWMLADIWFDIKYWNRETLYTRGTRHNIRARFRRNLMDPVGDKHIQQIVDACWQDNHLRRNFQRYAVKAPQTGREVWTSASFEAFITEQFRHDSHDLIAALAAMLWRNFCFTTVYPFADESEDPDDQAIDFEGWLQAVALLATDAGGNIRNNRSSAIYVYWSDESSVWLRFASALSDPMQRAAALIAGAKVTEMQNSPPDMMHQIAEVVRGQPTMMYVHVQPELGIIRSKIQRLCREHDATKQPIEDFTIPYQDLLSLLVAILHIDKRHPDYFTWQLKCEPVVVPVNDARVHIQVAKGILESVGIHEGEPVNFQHFWSLFQYTTRKDQSGGLNQDIQYLWRALFFNQLSETPNASLRPSPLVSQTLDLLLPFKQDPRARHARHTSRLLSSSSLQAPGSFEKLSNDLLSSFDQVFAIIHGTVLDSSSTDKGQPAMFAVMSTSPFWTEGKRGQHVSDVCHTGEFHILVELTPRPRALWYTHGRTLYKDLIHTDQERGFTYGSPAEDIDGTVCLSGLEVDLQNNTATLSAQPMQSKKAHRGYVEVELDQGFPKRVKEGRAWKTRIEVEKIEVFRYKEGIPQLETS